MRLAWQKSKLDIFGQAINKTSLITLRSIALMSVSRTGGNDCASVRPHLHRICVERCAMANLQATCAKGQPRSGLPTLKDGLADYRSNLNITEFDRARAYNAPIIFLTSTDAVAGTNDAR